MSAVEGETTARPPATGDGAISGIFISWAKLRRADTLAERLGIPSLAIRRLRRGTPLLLTLWKYFLQASETLGALVRRRPRVVFVTSPPIFAALTVWLYALIFRARFVIDFHSGAFLEKEWRRWDWLQRLLARRAALNIVHNDDNAKTAEAWGAPYVVLPSLPPSLEPSPGGPPVRSRPLAVYVCSWKSDEPVEALLEAARLTSGVDFRVTGRAPAGGPSDLPPNVELTGFLGEEEYNQLLRSADVLIALTTRPGTLLYGAQEAIALHKPLVLSRTPTLEAYFPEGTVFVENTAADLRVGILDALERHDVLQARMGAFERQYRAEGEARLAEVRRRLLAF
ncbi:MAG TPA: glycosyltransferase [Planctomycetota bacterium]|nr:glycosyltransferase [Planctomycetota bacterium]